MIVFPHCKINIGLRILSKRNDGYHNIESIFYPVKWFDVLEVVPSEEESFSLYGQPLDCSVEDNLCYKAYKLVKERYNIKPIKLCLLKNIPTGAGLGGGSSDAVFTVLCLNEIFQLHLHHDELTEIAAALGSDCVFFLKNTPAYITGRGEIYEPVKISLENYFIVIVKPQIHISTAEAYRAIIPKQRTETLKIITEKNISQWQALVGNDFEEPVFKMFPQIKTIKDIMIENGALYASLTGSGSAVYGIFDKKMDLKRHFENMVYYSGWL